MQAGRRQIGIESAPLSPLDSLNPLREIPNHLLDGVAAPAYSLARRWSGSVTRCSFGGSGILTLRERERRVCAGIESERAATAVAPVRLPSEPALLSLSSVNVAAVPLP